MFKKCCEFGCNKEFKCFCDFIKYEKIYLCFWKCFIFICKYYEFGWFIEKEMGCYLNDKYLDVLVMFECMFKLCLYKFKCEFNCK